MLSLLAPSPFLFLSIWFFGLFLFCTFPPKQKTECRRDGGAAAVVSVVRRGIQAAVFDGEIEGSLDRMEGILLEFAAPLLTGRQSVPRRLRAGRTGR